MTFAEDLQLPLDHRQQGEALLDLRPESWDGRRQCYARAYRIFRPLLLGPQFAGSFARCLLLANRSAQSGARS